jgi:hypothetical protein
MQNDDPNTFDEPGPSLVIVYRAVGIDDEKVAIMPDAYPVRKVIAAAGAWNA